MQADKGRIYYATGIDNTQLRTDAEESKRILQGITGSAVSEGAKIDSVFKSIGKTVTGVFAISKVKDFVVQVANVRGEFQQLEMAFKTMLGSAEKADALMSQLVKTATTTPFEMSEVAQGAKQLLAYGVEADKVNDTLIRLGDISAGLSIPLNDLAYLYGTTMVQGRLYTQDLNQFLGRGIPLTEELAKQFGVGKEQIRGLVEEGKVGFPQVEQAILSLTNEGGKFGGLMAAQSQTITGQISNLEDSFEQMLNEIGKSTEGVISDSIGLASSVVENWQMVGDVLIGLIGTYGAYKAAIMATAAIQNATRTVRHTEEAAQLYAVMNAEQQARISKLNLAKTSEEYYVAVKAEIQAEMERQTQLAVTTNAELAAAREKLTAAEAAKAAAAENVAAKRAELEAVIQEATTERTASLQKKMAIESEAQSRAALRIVKLQEQKDALISRAQALKEAQASAEVVAAKNREIAAVSQKIAVARAEEIQHSQNIVAIRKEMAATVDATTSKKIAEAETALETAQENLNTASKERNTAARQVSSKAALLDSTVRRANTVETAANTAAQTANASATGVLSVAKTKLTAVATRLNAVIMANPWAIALAAVVAVVSAISLFRDTTNEATDALKTEREEAEAFNKQVSESAGKAISTYKRLQDEYKKCKTAHEQRQWIKESQAKFRELGIAVTSVNDAENIFVRNTSVMMTAFKKRAEAAAWQSKIDEEYAKRIERQMQLEDERDKIQAGSKVPGSSHTTQGGNEYVDHSGNWVYTEQGAKNARDALNKSIANDPVLNAIDERISRYAERMTEVSSEFRGLFEQAGTTTKTDTNGSDNKQDTEIAKIEDQTAERTQKIQAYRDAVIAANSEAELDIRQRQIEGMEEGYDRQKAQIDLNYDRLIAENKKREQDMIEALKDTMVLEYQNNNPKATKSQTVAYRASLDLSAADLTSEQQAQLKSYQEIAEKSRIQGNKEALNTMLQDVMTYEQERANIAEEYAKKRNNLYEHDENGNIVKDGNGNSKLREGVSQGNIEELNRQEEEALKGIDEQFAQREETYKAWCNAIANLTLEQLEAVLAQAEAELDKVKKSGTQDSQKLATARAKVNTAKSNVSSARAKNSVSPDKRSIKEWEDLYKTLNECEKQFESIGDAVGGVAGDIIKTAGQIASSALSMINGIVQLVNMSAAGMTATASTAATAIQTVEKASVILTIISAALQIAMQIANLFNNDKAKQEEIEALQERIDQLQWELDNADIVRLQEDSGKAIDKVRQALSDTRAELLQNRLAVKDLSGTWRAFFSSVGDNEYRLTKSAQKLAQAYADIEYSAGKALGSEKYESGKEQLENIAKQQLLIQEQIDAESGKKKTDSEKIADWERQIEELGAQAVAVINDMVEDIIGGSAEDIASELGDAFFDAFQDGEDAAEAWGEKVNDIVSDVIKRMLVSEFLEKPLGKIFDEYKDKWFSGGKFIGLEAVRNSMGGFADDLNALGQDFAAIWETVPDSLKDLFNVSDDASRESSSKGIAAASQDSVDELNGRATAIQGHTYSINENTKMLAATAGLILQSVLNIENNTDGLSERMGAVEDNVRQIRNTVDDIALKGIKIK